MDRSRPSDRHGRMRALTPETSESNGAGGSPGVGEAAIHSRVYLHRDFTSHYLPGARDVAVYTPPDYNPHFARRYPVLYLHDGQNLFDTPASSQPGVTWQVREHADAAIESAEAEPLLIVGVFHAGERRVAEYTHQRDGRMGGEAEQYGLLLTRELMPWMAARYPVRAGREATGMGGSSLGGLVTLYLGLRYAEQFGKLVVLSPSVWWNHKSILGYVDACAPRISPKPRIWLDVGANEGGRTVEDAEELSLRLQTSGWRLSEDFHFERIAGGTHDEPSWALRVRPMLRFLFPAHHAR
jgi:predicted alpha/beta superfamily hydrolase